MDNYSLPYEAFKVHIIKTAANIIWLGCTARHKSGNRNKQEQHTMLISELSNKQNNCLSNKSYKFPRVQGTHKGINDKHS